MFFVLSKTAGLLIEPYYFALCLLAVAGLLRLLKRARRLRRGLALAAGLWVLVFATGPVANLLLYPLETGYTRPAKLPRPPGAIIMMGGVTGATHLSPSYYELNDSSERLVETLRLARLHPGARVLLTGGSSALIDNVRREADVVQRLSLELGLSASRIVSDREARNTRENAVNAGRLLRGTPQPWLLVTSASHMPRSVACFRKLGLEVTPWPVDYRRTESGPGAWLPKPQTLLRSNLALHEYLGWLAYWVMGYV
jgi:uncharacterized SAM-binding protein YcdF (DUF218 family)